MNIRVLKGNKETMDTMRGQIFVPQDGEGIVYLKLVLIKPSTMKDGDPSEVVEKAEGVILCGQLSDIQAQIATWFAESAQQYKE